MASEISVVDVEEISNDTSDLPNCQGVYAWYKKISIDDTTKSDFDRSVENILTKEWVGEVKSKTNLGKYIAEISLTERVKEITDAKRKIANLIKGKSNKRAKFSYLSIYASVMQEPIYIGKGDNLERRISRHINGHTGFYDRIREAGFGPTDCVLLYLELRDLPTGSNKLLEYIVDSLTSPYYGKQSG